MHYKKQFSKEQAFQKLKLYCAYQERSHAEVKEKARSLGLRKAEVEELTAKLIEEDYLNEERFARLFAGGKFRIKQWGRIKIKYELKQKRVSDYCISKAMKEIDETAYLGTLNRLAKKKWNSVKDPEVNLLVKMVKTRNYLLQKGYEPELVASVLKALQQ
jgi:regulatory protein